METVAKGVGVLIKKSDFYTWNFWRPISCWWLLQGMCLRPLRKLENYCAMCTSYASESLPAGVKHHSHVLQKGFWQCKQVGLRSRSTSALQIVGEAQVVQGLKKARGRVQKKRHMSLWTVASFSLYSQMQERSMIKYFGTVCCVSVTLIQNYHVCMYCAIFKLNVLWVWWRGHLLAYNWLSYGDFCLLHSL